MNTDTLGFDATFEINDFNQPKILSDVEMMKNILLYLLFSKPGDYPSLPEVGMNLNDLLYNYYDDIDESLIKDRLIQQCPALEFFFNSGNIQIKKVKYRNQPSMIIHISGKPVYPKGYMTEGDGTNEVLIGITFNEMKELMLSIQ